MQGPQTTIKPAMVSPVPVSAMASPILPSDPIPAIPSPAFCRRGRSLRPRGFTLTELLIVIAIIGVLASLIAAAAVNALRAAKRARIVLEIKNMAGAVENFKNDYGSYPPNAMNPNPGNNPLAGSPTALAQRDVVGAFKKAFPRSQEPPALILGLCGQNLVSGGPNLPNGMSAAEALYFWLGGFSSDAQYPISGPGGPSFADTGTVGDEVLESRQGGYEFALGRLGPRVDGELDFDNVRIIEYSISMNGNPAQDRRINFWQFYPEGSERPYVYFDCSRNKPYQYDMPAFVPAPSIDPPRVFALLQLRSGAPANATAEDLIYANQNKYQILHAGLDDSWGAGTFNNAVGPTMGDYPAIDRSEDPAVYTIFPTGPFTGEVADTLSNITDGELADSQE